MQLFLKLKYLYFILKVVLKKQYKIVIIFIPVEMTEMYLALGKSEKMQILICILYVL